MVIKGIKDLLKLQMDEIDLKMLGKKIRNVFQVFDLSFLFLLEEIGKVSVKDLEEEVVYFWVEINGKVIEIRLEYQKKFAVFTWENQMVVDLDFFFREFLYKRYVVSQNHRFSELLVKEKFCRLRALVRRNFLPQRVIFGILNKDLFCKICSFLNKESMFELSWVSFEIRGYFEMQKIWEGVFRYRWKNIRFDGADIDWKKCFLARKELVLNKIVTNSQGIDWQISSNNF